MNPISIMQGRLLPPFEGRFQAFPAGHWKDEFYSAANLGLHSIEWIYEKPHEYDNPLGSDEGIAQIKEISKETGVGVYSVCADYYMTEHLIIDGAPSSQHWDHLQWLCGQSSKLGLTYIILPFVDSSSLKSPEDCKILAFTLKDFLTNNHNHGVEIHLESDLSPKDFLSIFEAVNHPFLKMNYDIGNSASLGYNPDEEFDLLGNYLGSVHIKDRALNGSTVPLGTGNATFTKCFEWFHKLSFKRWFVLQVARGEINHENETTLSHIRFIKDCMGCCASWN